MSDYRLTLDFEVKRLRPSVTQGGAAVYCNGQLIAEFRDEIELQSPGAKYYGENIGGWASNTPDASFIRSALYHKYDDLYQVSKPIKEILQAAIDAQTAAAAIQEGGKHE